MSEGGVESRVTSLESQVRDLRARLKVTEQDAAAARVLAGAADRDVGEIRGELRDFRRAAVASLSAVREDLVDISHEMRAKFELAAAGQQQIVGLLETLIDRDSM